eukprot:34045-Prorocentrum_minimum.AAC.1
MEIQVGDASQTPPYLRDGGTGIGRRRGLPVFHIRSFGLLGATCDYRQLGKNGGWKTWMHVYATSVSATARAYAGETLLFLMGPIKDSFAHVPG